MPDSSAAPDSPAAISALARSHARTCVDVLVAALDSPSPGERIAAAIALLNRGFGKPTQPIALDTLHGITIELSESPSTRPNGEDDAVWRARVRQRGD